MSYISTRKLRIQTRLTHIQARLAVLNDAMDEMSATGVSSYEFDSGEGRQRTTRRSLKEISDEILRLEAEEDHYSNELYNMGILSVKLRRR